MISLMEQGAGFQGAREQRRPATRAMGTGEAAPWRLPWPCRRARGRRVRVHREQVGEDDLRPK